MQRLVVFPQAFFVEVFGSNAFSEAVYFEGPHLCVTNPGFGVVKCWTLVAGTTIYRGMMLGMSDLWNSDRLQENLMSHCRIRRADFNALL